MELRQHPRYPNIICSSDGRVFLERKGWKRGGADGVTYRAVDWWTGEGRWKSGTRIIEYVHRLVAETFGQDIAGADVDHNDKNPTNNRPDNLESTTVSENRGARGRWS